MTDAGTPLIAVAEAARAVAATRSRTVKTSILADLLRGAPPDEVPVLIGLLLGRPVQGRIGVGWRTVVAAAGGAAADDGAAGDGADAANVAEPTLRVAEVDALLTALAGLHGPGSGSARTELLGTLLGRATPAERDLLLRVLTGEVRTGALAGVVTEAVALAAAVPAPVVRRAAMLSGDLGGTARAALTGADLTAVRLTPGIPVQPMLASTAGTAADAVAGLGAVSVEYKLDGARLQVHRVGGRVTAYTRSLDDVTARVPEIVELVAGLPGGDLVLDGETLSLDAAGSVRPFQETMSRFGSTSAATHGGNPDTALSVWFFDALYAGGRPLIDEPLTVRRAELAAAVGDRLIGGAVLDGSAEANAAGAQRVLDAALAAGHEGIVVKSLAAPYAAGRRGAHWVKVKPVYTYDLVVLAVERGSGRRREWLSNLHLGARDPEGAFGEPGGFVMVGKTFKGLTDDLLRWQTAHFPTIASGSAGHVLHLRPDTVVEIAIDGVQRSARYPGGAALRFARVKRYRTGADAKPADQADTIDAIRALLPGAGAGAGAGDEAG